MNFIVSLLLTVKVCFKVVVIAYKYCVIECNRIVTKTRKVKFQSIHTVTASPAAQEANQQNSAEIQFNDGHHWTQFGC